MFKILGLVVLGAVASIGLTVSGVYALSEMRLNQRIDVPTESITIPTDITSIQRGQHLASAIGLCIDCHGPNLAGRVIVDEPAIRRIVAPNLTRGGLGAMLLDSDFVRAIRHGLDPSGRLLLSMPSDNYNHFGDSDLAAIVAYVRAIPASNSSLPSSEVRPLGRVLFVAGRLPLQPATNIDQTAPRPATPRTGVTPEYGQYLAEAAGCPACHGPGYSGGKVPQAPPASPPAANLTPLGLSDWSEADFLKAMRNGVRPDGRVLDTIMPWPYFAQMTDDELRAIWSFLRVLPARQSGTR